MSEDIYKKIGKKIRMLRERRGLSQQDLANKLDYKSKVSVSKLETGEQNINVETILKLSDVFKVPIESLLDEPAVEGGQKKLVEILSRDELLTAKDIDKIISFINFLRLEKKRQQQSGN